MKKYDLVIIGSGAGMMLIEPALSLGLSCAIVEHGRFGGTCLTKGCIPSKILVYPADLIRSIQKGKRIGISTGDIEVDWAKLSERMWTKINYSNQIEEGLSNIDGLDVYKGTGQFVDRDTMQVRIMDKDEMVAFQSDKFVVAAGARNFVPPIDGLEATGYVSSEGFFGDLFPNQPWKSLIIVGGGAIGAEFAHIFAALGTKVTIIEMKPNILPTEEKEISDFVRQQFEKVDIDVFTDTRAVSVKREGDFKTLEVENTKTKARTEIQAEEIFIASGLVPNTDILQIDRTGVKCDDKGWIITNERLETNIDKIWALGDINGKYQFRHKANYEAEILATHLFPFPNKRTADYHTVPWAIFTWPQIARVGMTEKEAKDKEHKVYIGRNSYASVAAGSAMGYDNEEDSGFVKIVVGENKKILGAHIVGPYASVLIQPFVYLMHMGYKCKYSQMKNKGKVMYEHDKALVEACRQMGTFQPILDSMVIHPSLGELTAWALAGIDWSHEV